MKPKFNFILGAGKMKQDTLLSSEQEGQLFKMHQYVVPGLDFQTKDGYLEDRWVKREQSGAGDYFIAYLHRNGQVESMVSGTIRGKDLYVINTATLPERRQKGYLKGVLHNLVLYLSENHQEVKNFHGLLSSGISTSKHQEITPEVLQEINEQSNKIQFVEDEKAQIYGNTLGRTVQALKNDERGQELHKDITSNPRYNFQVGKKVLDEVSQVTDTYADMGKGANFNFTPYAKQDPELTSHSLNQVQQFDKKRRLSFEEKLQQKEGVKDKGYCGGRETS